MLIDLFLDLGCCLVSVFWRFILVFAFLIYYFFPLSTFSMGSQSVRENSVHYWAAALLHEERESAALSVQVTCTHAHDFCSKTWQSPSSHMFSLFSYRWFHQRRRNDEDGGEKEELEAVILPHFLSSVLSVHLSILPSISSSVCLTISLSSGLLANCSRSDRNKNGEREKGKMWK